MEDLSAYIHLPELGGENIQTGISVAREQHADYLAFHIVVGTYLLLSAEIDKHLKREVVDQIPFLYSREGNASSGDPISMNHH